MEGFIVVNKPVWNTSFHIVSRVRKQLKTQKVGHAGTLDPFAEGVLVVAVGKALRVLEYVQNVDKEYILTIMLGSTSSTLDPEGEIIITEKNLDKITVERVQNVLQQFLGDQQQIPPSHSALRINGKRAYHLARKGEHIVLESRKVQIKEIELLGVDLPTIRIRVVCSSGTYMRSLARDVGAKLGVGAYAIKLLRTRVGEFCLDMSISPNDEISSENVLGISNVKLPYFSISLTENEKVQFLHGIQVEISNESKLNENTIVQVRSIQGNELLGVAQLKNNKLVIKKVLY